MGKIVGIILAIIVLPFAAVGFMIDTSHTAPTPNRSAKPVDREWATGVVSIRVLRASMHDPRSFQVDQVLRMPDKTLCVTYRAKNGFGAVRAERAVIAPKTGAVQGQTAFVGLWNKHCGGRTGEDISHIRHAI